MESSNDATRRTVLKSSALGVGALAGAAAVTAATAAPAHAATKDYLLLIEGVRGPGRGGEIEIESFSWGATNAGTTTPGGGGGAGKVQFQDFHFVMRSGAASPELFLACATGKHYPKATLTARKAGGRQEGFYRIELKDVLVSSYQSGGSDGAVPTDQISLSFASVKFL